MKCQWVECNAEATLILQTGLLKWYMCAVHGLRQVNSDIKAGLHSVLLAVIEQPTGDQNHGQSS